MMSRAGREERVGGADPGGSAAPFVEIGSVPHRDRSGSASRSVRRRRTRPPESRVGHPCLSPTTPPSDSRGEARLVPECPIRPGMPDSSRNAGLVRTSPTRRAVSESGDTTSCGPGAPPGPTGRPACAAPYTGRVTDADASNTTGSAGAASNGTPEPAAVERPGSLPTRAESTAAAKDPTRPTPPALERQRKRTPRNTTHPSR